MPYNIRVPKFAVQYIDTSRMVRWSGSLSPIADEMWMTAFGEEVQAALSVGSCIGENLSFSAESITFSAREGDEKAAADGIRAAVAKANIRAERCAAEQQKQDEGRRREAEDINSQTRRLKEEYRDGL